MCYVISVCSGLFRLFKLFQVLVAVVVLFVVFGCFMFYIVSRFFHFCLNCFRVLQAVSILM